MKKVNNLINSAGTVNVTEISNKFKEMNSEIKSVKEKSDGSSHHKGILEYNSVQAIKIIANSS